MNDMYIDVGHTESRLAVIEDGELAEVYIERENREKITGNIYKGIVENVLPGMQAAFINIGLEKNAFLYIKDAVDYNMLDRGNCSDDVSINNILKPGDELIVQVSKEPIGTKGARVTTHPALPGRNIVLMPEVDYIGVSRRIEDSNERERLRNIISKLKPGRMGAIIRTEAEGKSLEDFALDMEFLTKLWDRIKSEALMSKSPRLIYKDLDLVYRAIRDLLNRDTAKIVISEKSSYKRAVDIMELISPDKKNILEYYDGSINIMEFYGIESRIEKALSRKVWLKSGGYVVIDQTEALTVIDVNTGKFTGSVNLKDTVLLTNTEAAREIARQLRLRDIGGIIIIDFIDMISEDDRNTIVEILRSELKKDRTKSTVFGITQLGLVEMTRKKMGKRLSSIIQKTCPLCDGSGRILDEDTVIRVIERKLDRIFKETDVPAVLVEVNDTVFNYLNETNNNYIKHLEESYGKRIILRGLSNLEYNEVRTRYLTGVNSIDNALNPLKEGDKIQIKTVKPGQLNASSRYEEFEGRVHEILSDDENRHRIVVDIKV